MYCGSTTANDIGFPEKMEKINLRHGFKFKSD
jgi:hypothetical protein